MGWLNNLSISRKLIISFCMVLSLTLFLGIFAVERMAAVNTVITDITTNQMQGSRSISKLNALVGSFRRGELLIAVSKDAEGKQKYLKRNAEALEKLRAEQAVYEKLIDSDEEKKLYGEFKSALEGYLRENPKIVELALQDKAEEVDRLIRGDSSKYFNQTITSLEKAEDSQVQQAKAQEKQCSSLSRSSQVWIVIALACCIAFGLLLALGLARVISRPICELARKAALITAGDLTVTVDKTTNDEIGALSGAFAAMVANLRGVIGRVNETALHVSSAAHQLQGTSQQVAVAAEEVVAQAGTVATASEEMAATAGEIAQNCSVAADNSRQAECSAQSGSDVIKTTISGMHRIADQVKGAASTVESLGARSDQIGAIIGTIEDIADQTNLLALNAAIEAARAGDQGRGFAVVADEVRALAERTTKATREIGDMIKSIQSETKEAVQAMNEGVREVARGTDDAAKSGDALQEIIAQIEGVTAQVNQIATAAEEQTATTNEITNNIIQINCVVQQSALGAQQSSAAATALAQHAENLREAVQRFKLA